MKIKLLIVILLSFLLCGCYNYREINDLAIVSAVGIDKNKENYEVVAQIVNTQNNNKNANSNSSSSFYVYTDEGKTLQSAYRNIINNTGKFLYVSHLQLVVLSEEVAKDGIYDTLNLFMRDNDVRKQVLVIVSKKSSKETLETITSLINLNAENIKEILLSNERYIGTTKATTIEDIVSNYLSRKTEITIPSFDIENIKKDDDNIDELKDSNESNTITYSGMSIFKKDKLLGYLNNKESLTLNIVNNEINNFLLNIKCDDEEEYYVIEVSNNKSDLKYKKDLKFDLKFTGNGVLTEFNCKTNVESYKSMEKIEKKTNEYLKKLIDDSITNVKNEFNSDIFGFQNIIYKSNPKYYKKIKKTFYEEYFNNINVSVKTNVKIISRGNLLKEIKYE